MQISGIARLKNQKGKSWVKTLENLIFLCDFNKFSQNWGWRGQIALFYSGNLLVSFWNIETNYRQLYLYRIGIFFNLYEITTVKKGNISSFLIPKCMRFNFYLQMGYVQQSRNNLFGLKMSSKYRYCPANKAKFSILHIYFAKLFLKF